MPSRRADPPPPAIALAGLLAGWLGQPGQVYGGSAPTSAGSGATETDPAGGLSAPTEAPTAADQSSADSQPPVVAGGS